MYKLDHIRLHDLRHYNAIIMLRSGIPDKVAAERLGHTNVQTLREVYQHVLKDMDEAAAKMINNAINPKAFLSDKPLTKEERKAMFKVI
ncbi:tyrosine-type recombinase/integrase [Lachnospiraceae bacterium MD1]|uniref:Tyrosine-type recombinase/integrase n=2 Tax=Variimorphobacter saccharofermentans TaxID=2755051 RepID=A0A839JW42_9FIRM|nr:tyrosine-type recombinase/integrase [Variimorphobacter saccharofermentans]